MGVPDLSGTPVFRVPAARICSAVARTVCQHYCRNAANALILGTLFIF
jgi:hypothetical protein